MFIQRKTKAVKVYAYRMLLSFNTSITYTKNFNFMPGNCDCCEAAFVGHNSIFTGHCPMLSINIQACPVALSRLTATIRNKILNFKEMVQSIIVHDKISISSCAGTCACNRTSFSDENHGHIVQGD